MTATSTVLVVDGTVAFLERIALPPGAVLSVQLRDVARADSSPTVLAAVAIPVEGQVPVPYSLSVDSAAIDPQAQPSVWAFLRSDVGHWQTDTDNPVDLSDGPVSVDVIVRRLPTDGSDATTVPADG